MNRLPAIMVLLLLVISLPSDKARAANVFTFIEGGPEQVVWVGQQVAFFVSISMSDRPDGSPRFIIPDVQGGVLLKLEDSPIYDTESRDGAVYTTWKYSFVFYSHRAGDNLIPPVIVYVRLPESDGAITEYQTETEPLRFVSQMPPGAEALTTLITTTTLIATESWNPDHTELLVGDAFTRVIELRASDLMGMGFPPLTFTSSGVMAIHQKPPQINDEIHRGEMVGQRIETVIYICEQAGEFILPALVIPWFDLTAQELKRVTFPERRIQVSPNPAFAEVAESPMPVNGSHKWKFKILPFGLGLVTICIIGVLIRRYRKSMWNWIHRRQKRINQPKLSPLPPLNP
jgi:hypothetical protein